jgi:hypothetical protein
MDWLKAIYGVFGAEYPILSLVGAAVLGAFMLGGAWWLVGREYRKEHPQTVTAELSPLTREEDSPEKVSPDSDEASSPRDTSASAPSRGGAVQNVENNQSPGANVYQAGRDIIVTPPATAQELRIRSLTLEVRLTCVLKEPHGDLPPDEVPFMPVGDANAYLEGPPGRQRLTFSSPVRFRRLSDNRIVVINRFALDPAGDLVNQPSHVLANYQNVIAPVITIVWGKEFEKFTLLELSLSLNGADPVYYSWPYDVVFQTEPVFTVGFDNFKKKLGL